MKKTKTQGFTIIELLIATVIFSVILLVITGAIIQFSKLYYKGVATTKAQETARAIADEMSRAAQFSVTDAQPAANTATAGVYCFGDKRFSYGTESAADKGVVVSTSASCTPNMTVAGSNRQLVGEGMQLVGLTVDRNGLSDNRQFEITVQVAYGSAGDRNPDGTCKVLSLGGQFCAVSTVKSTVTRRL